MRITKCKRMPVSKLSKDPDAHQLVCLRNAAELRSMVVDGLTPSMKQYFLRVAANWEMAAEKQCVN